MLLPLPALPGPIGTFPGPEQDRTAIVEIPLPAFETPGRARADVDLDQFNGLRRNVMVTTVKGFLSRDVMDEVAWQPPPTGEACRLA